ncbi:MAG: chromosome segregation protein SMC [Halobacteriota archaeon]|jgi:chromosome segregation protein
MFIKELEIHNFKSFGKRVKIPFFDDFTAVSGPNGSGKSNIVDSVLFCLGLSTSRTMRAEKLTDLIFNGDGANEAMVKVRFDNADAELPADTEVTVARKVRRTASGYYSYYYLDGKPCTLADIHELLSKACITPEGYNVVLQGDITRIIEVSPLERRKIIDEIAGVAEFDRRRDRALDELEVVRERVERVDIILNEVALRLEQLKVEREYALKYQELKAKKHDYEKMVFASKLSKLAHDIKAIEGDLERRQRSKDKAVNELAATREAIYDLEGQLSALNSAVSEKGENEQFELARHIENIKGDIAQHQNRVDLVSKEVEHLETQKRKAFIEVNALKQKHEALQSDLAAETVRRASLASELDEQERELNALKEQLSNFDSDVTKARDDLFEKRKALGEEKDKRGDVVRARDRVLDIIRRASTDVQAVEREIDAARTEVGTAQSDLETLHQNQAELTRKLEDAREDIKDLEARREDLKLAIETVERRLNQAHQDFVRAETRLKESFGKAVEAIMAAQLPGVRGVVAELGRVDPRYATALEIAAGPRLRNIIVDTDADAARAIAYLKENNAGRATFLPLNKMKPVHRETLQVCDGVIDYAINLVQFDPEYAAAFSYVFGRTVVVTELEAARRLIGTYRMVTLEGELLEVSGAMTGGIDRRALKFIAGEEQELHRLGRQIREYEKERARSQQEFSQVDDLLLQARHELVASEGERERLVREATALEARKAQAEASADEKVVKLAAMRQEKEQAGAQINELEEQEVLHGAEIVSLERDIADLEKRLKGTDASTLTEDISQIADEVRRLQNRVSRCDATVTEFRLHEDYNEKKLGDAKEHLETTDGRIKELRSSIREHTEAATRLEHELDDVCGRERDLARELSELREGRDALLAQISVKETAKAGLQRQIDRTEQAIDALDYQRLELEARRDELKAEAGEIDEMPFNEPYEAVVAGLRTLESQLESMNDVNMRAIEDYDNVERRQQDLSSRKETLFNERVEILERIDRYGQMKKEALLTAFNSINANFKDIYADLSGATGELALENYEDPFDGGLFIRSWQQGKHVQRIEGMSGGEKSLAALAMIFAIQRYLPAPFYMFDEIDMFLDGANAERVARMIKKLSVNAQFIVVSLRKPMIEAASRTIGVSMQEGNISSVTGVKLN